MAMSVFHDPTVSQLLGLKPGVRAAAVEMLNWQRQWLPVIISEGYRSQARQNVLYSRGRSRPGPIVTQTLSSRHTTGRAFDIDIATVPPDQVPSWVWTWSGAVGEALGLRWGGRFARLKDFRHFEG